MTPLTWLEIFLGITTALTPILVRAISTKRLKQLRKEIERLDDELFNSEREISSLQRKLQDATGDKDENRQD